MTGAQSRKWRFIIAAVSLAILFSVALAAAADPHITAKADCPLCQLRMFCAISAPEVPEPERPEFIGIGDDAEQAVEPQTVCLLFRSPRGPPPLAEKPAS